MSLQTITSSTETVESPNKRMKFMPEVRDLTIQEQDSRIYEYTSAANPNMAPVPVLVHPASLHESGPTRIIPFDLSEHMNISYPATSPNLMAYFLRICPNESLNTRASATSQAFYIIRGSGSTSSKEHGEIEWSEGDLFVLPKTDEEVVHKVYYYYNKII
jgi:hypothetical protein